MNRPVAADIRIGILTVSDRASRGEYRDLGGPAIQEYMTRAVAGAWHAVYRIVPDEQPLIESTLIELCDQQGCCLVITTGGTGPAQRDVTPQATEVICQRMMPGFGELMRAMSLQHVPTAILSRQTAGIRGQSLVINLPGKPRAISQCLQAVMPAVPYCIDLLEGPRIETNEEFVRAWRPGSG